MAIHFSIFPFAEIPSLEALQQEFKQWSNDVYVCVRASVQMISDKRQMTNYDS